MNNHNSLPGQEQNSNFLKGKGHSKWQQLRSMRLCQWRAWNVRVSV